MIHMYVANPIVNHPQGQKKVTVLSVQNWRFIIAVATLFINHILENKGLMYGHLHSFLSSLCISQDF